MTRGQRNGRQLINMLHKEAIPQYTEFRIDREIVVEVAKCQIEDGDTMIVRVPEETTDGRIHSLMSALRQWLTEAGFAKVKILVTKGLETRMEALNEAEMSKLGWIRKDSWIKRIH